MTASDIASPADSLFAAVNADGTLAAGGPEATGSTRSDAGRGDLHGHVQPRREQVLVHRERHRRLGQTSPSASQGGPAANQVRVDQRDAADGNAGRAFHLQVIC